MLDVSPDGSFDFSLHVLIDEFVNVDIAPSHSNLNLALLINLQKHSFWAEPINAIGLSDEHDPELGSVGDFVDELAQGFIDWVVNFWNVNVFFLSAFV